MLIVCPNCATSYMIDPASVGPAGRSVRCARCKSTWFAGAPKSPSNVSAYVDSVIAEAEAQQKPSPNNQPAAAMDDPPAPAADDFGNNAGDPFPPPTEPGMPPAYDSFPQDDAAPGMGGPDRGDGLAVTDAPSLVPPIEHDPFPPPEDGPITDVEDNESYVARRQRLKAKRQKSKRMSRWTAVILVLFAFNVALIGARSDVVRYLPQTASLFAAIGLPVNLRNLKFENVKIVKEGQDGVSILIIEGIITNTANKPTDVPRLRFAARNAGGQDVYTWSARPSRDVLGPKESMEFQSRLAAPPADATDVMVRFFSAQDAAGGISGPTSHAK
jgi:predicted Zn finger-like uncharacterized protein